MSKTVKIGGIGKSPAIEKINQIREMESLHFAGELIKEKSLVNVAGEGAKNIAKQKAIIEQYQIEFQKE